MKKFPITLYPTVTPNPNTIKFMADKYLLQPEEDSVDFRTLEEAKDNSPLAVKLFEHFPYITGVFIERNFISISKNEEEMPWDYLTPEVRGFIHHYIVNGNEIVNLSPKEKNEKKVNFESSPLDSKIKDLMKQFVDEPVRGDGGKIEFQSYKDGVVTVVLKGACVGCPARNKTLKQGIEDILKSHIPEIKEVIASNG
ncbi:MAG TPA: NifU family protein [Brumimicrobium sp.]|nr:NifU family protein [Brumimicrobium sp.]